MKRIFALLLCSFLATYSMADNYHFEVDGIYYIKQGGIAAVVKKENGNSGYTGEINIPSSVTYNDVTYTVTRIYTSAFFNSSITKITLPNTITEILGTAFLGSNQLKEITLPSSLATIGTGAFAQTGLTHITIPAAVEYIGYQDDLYYGGAFEGCESLETVVFEEEGCKLTYLPSKIFAGCVNLKSIVFPSSLNNIGGQVIGKGRNKKGCEKMTSISLPENLLVIGNSAFADSYLKNITIPGTVKRIERDAFYNCNELQSVILKEGINRLEERGCPFSYCNNLTNIYLPSTLEAIPGYFFNKLPNLKSITIPSNVKSIGEQAFYECKALTTVNLPNKLETIGRSAFDNCTSLSLILPASVNKVGESAFSRISSLKITDYDRWMELVVKERVFGATYGWSKVYQNGSLVKNYVLPSGTLEIPDNTFYKNKDLLSVTMPSTVSRIGKGAFRECTELVSANMPDGLTMIDEQAFYQCNKLTGISFPHKLEAIESSAFALCSSLTEICFGKGIKSIEQNAFYGCESVSKVDIGDVGNWCNVEFGGKPSGGLQTGNPLTLSKRIYLNGVELTELTIPSNVTKIKDYVFNNCIYLNKLVIPNSVTSIGNYAFSCCSGLMSIDVPSAINTLGEGTFYKCSGITTFNLPEHLSELSPYLFYQCSNLQSVTTHAGINSIGDYAFSGCKKLNSISIPEGVEIIKKYAFQECSNLSSINIPSSVKTIGVGAFNSCSGLNALHITDMAAWSCIKYVYQYNQGAGTGTAMEPQFMASNPLRYAHHLYLNDQKVTQIVIPTGVTDITPIAFWGLSDVESVIIPSTVKSIGHNAFAGSSIRTIYCYAEVAPELYKYKVYLQYNTFEKDDSNIPHQFDGTVSLSTSKLNLEAIYVPQDGLLDYKSHWSSYSDVIYPMPESQVEKICFRDAEVKRICLENWDTNDDEELTIDEARSVTELNYKFKNNQTIKSFNELQCFTGLKSIKYAEFDGCTSLESIILPEGLEEIEDAPFGNCNALKSIIIPASVTKIGTANIGTFMWNLKSIKVDEGNTVYDSRYDCNAIIEKASGKLIIGCQSTVIPNDVTTIAAWAFNTCLEKPIEIPESITTIEKNAFLGNHFKTIVLPSSLTSMTWAFQDCSLKMVESHIINPFDLDERTFNMAENAVLYVPQGTKELYEKTDGWNKFAAIIEIEPETSENVINFEDEKVKQLCLENWDLNSSGEISLNEAEGILNLERVFFTSGITSFKELQYFTRLKSIGDYAFKESGLTDVVLPQSIESIGASAFFACKMTEFEIPANVTSIGGYAFRSSKLASVRVNRKEPIVIEENAFPTRSNVVLHVPLGCKTAYEEANVWKDFKEITDDYTEGGATFASKEDGSLMLSNMDDYSTKVIIPSTLTVDGQEYPITGIGDGAFENNETLGTVCISGSIAEIGENAFAGCKNLLAIFNYGENPADLTGSVKALTRSGEEVSVAAKVFAEVDLESCELYVPAGCSQKYMAAEGWNEFKNIREMIKGDANGDKKVNAADVVEAINAMNGQQSSKFIEFNADIDGNGKITDEDIQSISNFIMGIKISGKALSEATNEDVGSVIASDGKVYPAGTLGIAPIAMIVYVGEPGTADKNSSTYRGLAIALSDDEKSVESSLKRSGPYNIVVDVQSDLNGLSCPWNKPVNEAPEGTSGWFIPSSGQFYLFLKSLGMKRHDDYEKNGKNRFDLPYYYREETDSEYGYLDEPVFDIVTMLRKAGDLSVDFDYTGQIFWSCTYNGINGRAYYLSFNRGGIHITYGASDAKARFRPFLAF